MPNLCVMNVVPFTLSKLSYTDTDNFQLSKSFTVSISGKCADEKGNCILIYLDPQTLSLSHL